jgi:glycosyltransferase involved in cell wall biosynthesis
VEGDVADLRARPRLLFLCQTLPYPPDGGVWIRTYHVLRLLARTFDVTVLCFERARSAGRTAGVAAGHDGLRRFGPVDVFPLPQAHSRLRFLWDHARSLLTGQVYTRYLYDSRAFRRRLDEVLDAVQPDLVHADSLDLAQYLPACQSLPIVCVHHDVESMLLSRKASVEPVAWKRAYLRHQARLMAAVERQWLPRVALNVAVSEQDRASLLRLAPEARVIVVANGVDVDEFAPASEDAAAAGLAYVGGTSPAPNRDALQYFCDRILPHLGHTGGHRPVRWIGRASPDEQRHYRERHGVELTGYVDDARPLMRAAACHIAPLRAGGGTRVKILNAWAMGKAVVSTSVGCEGLEAVDGHNVLIRDDPRAFARAIQEVLGNPDLRGHLGRRGRATAERLYSWDVVGEGMTAAYRGACHAVD